MNTCIYTRRQFADASGEHILQNSLGARWTDSTIACDEIQQNFGDTIDVAVAESLQGFRTLLGTLGGRRGAPPPLKNVPDQLGNFYHIAPGGEPSLARPNVDVKVREDGSATVHIQAADESQLPWALHILRQEHPHSKIDLQALATGATRSRDHLESPLHLQFGIGGPAFFRGIAKSIFNLLGATHREVALSPQLDAFRAFIVTESGQSDDFVGWPPSPQPLDLPRLGAHDHFLAVWSLGGTVRACVQLFGEFPFMFRLGTGIACDDFCASYLVDPHREAEPAERRGEDFDPASLPDYEDCPHLPGPEIWKAHTARLKRFLASFQLRAEANVVANIVEEVLGPKEGHIFTQEDADELHKRLMKYVYFKLGIKEPREVPQPGAEGATAPEA